MTATLPHGVECLRSIAEEVSREVIARRAAEVDREGAWPGDSLQALRASGLAGLHVPVRLGGLEQGLLALAAISDTIASACPSSALCFGMHCTATAVIAAKSTSYHEEHYLVPIARGNHLTTLALSELGTGVHFYMPETEAREIDAGYALRGRKQFVTNGAHANSYVVSSKSSNAELGEFSCFVLDADAEGASWGPPWDGFGMRGNSSRELVLDDTRVPREALLGEEGDQIWFVFEVVAPYFLIAMAGTYTGIADAALKETLAHLKRRRFDHSTETLADVPVLQHKVAEMGIAVARARSLVYHAALLGDLGDPGATTEIMMAKAEAAETAVRVTNEAMTVCGGSAYRENGRLAQLLRDARAGHVMAPTTDLLKSWTGRLLLGRPLL